MFEPDSFMPASAAVSILRCRAVWAVSFETLVVDVCCVLGLVVREPVEARQRRLALFILVNGKCKFAMGELV